MSTIKICPICGAKFKVWPSRSPRTCSQRCGKLLLWQDLTYKETQSKAHQGKSTWSGRKHSRESILKMRSIHLRSSEPQLRRNGYIYIYAPDHPRQINGRVPEQILIAERVIGRLLKPTEVVHHINGNKIDNRNGNLLVCESRYHQWLHSKLNGLGTVINHEQCRDHKTGRFIPGVTAYEERV